MILQSIQRYSGGFDVRFSDVSEHELKALVELFVGTLTESATTEMPDIDGRNPAE